LILTSKLKFIVVKSFLSVGIPIFIVFVGIVKP
jgi:hypothetical protein